MSLAVDPRLSSSVIIPITRDVGLRSLIGSSSGSPTTTPPAGAVSPISQVLRFIPGGVRIPDVSLFLPTRRTREMPLLNNDRVTDEEVPSPNNGGVGDEEVPPLNTGRISEVGSSASDDDSFRSIGSSPSLYHTYEVGSTSTSSLYHTYEVGSTSAPSLYHTYEVGSTSATPMDPTTNKMQPTLLLLTNKKSIMVYCFPKFGSTLLHGSAVHHSPTQHTCNVHWALHETHTSHICFRYHTNSGTCGGLAGIIGFLDSLSIASPYGLFPETLCRTLDRVSEHGCCWSLCGLSRP